MSKLKNTILYKLIIVLRYGWEIILSLLILFGSFLKHLFNFVFKYIFFPLYKICHQLNRKLKFLRLLSMAKIRFVLLHKKNIHLIIIICAFLVVTHNIRASDIQEGNYHDRPLYYSLNKIEEEEIIESGLPEIPVITEMEPLPALSYQEFNETEAPADIQEKDFIQLGESSAMLINPNIDADRRYVPPRDDIEYYIVQSGDTIGAIADKYGLSQETILWENNLSYNSLIKPGQKITILQVDGLSHIVKGGDTIAKIAKKYNTEEEKILEFNQLASEDTLQVDQKLIIPGGRKPSAAPVRTPTQTASRRVYYGNPQGGHIFPWGHCTYYVANKRYIPWGGDAKYWLRNAQSYGYAIGVTPQVGAIIATRESWWGHVGYVEAVGNGTVTFSEMNYKGLGVYSQRTFSVKDRRIIGYIY